MCKIRFCSTHVCSLLYPPLWKPSTLTPRFPKGPPWSQFHPWLAHWWTTGFPDSSNGFSTRSIYWNWSQAAFKSHGDNQRNVLAVRSDDLEVFTHSLLKLPRSCDWRFLQTFVVPDQLFPHLMHIQLDSDTSAVILYVSLQTIYWRINTSNEFVFLCSNAHCPFIIYIWLLTAL